MRRGLLPFVVPIYLLCSCVQNGRVRQEPQDGENVGAFVPAGDRLALTGRLLEPGSFAPTIRLPLLSGAEGTTAGVTGKRHVVMFWASWCGDCKEATPAVVRLQGERTSLPWLTVSLDNQAKEARLYIIYNGIGGTHFFDGRGWKGAACMDYAVPLHGIPYFFLIDSIGRIEWCGGEAAGLKEFLDGHEEPGPDSAP